MAKTYLQIQKQIEDLQKEAESLRKKEADGVLDRIKEAIGVYKFTPQDLGFGKAAASSSTKRGPGVKQSKKGKPKSNSAKYKDDQGNEWGGRGPRPAWFKAALEAGKSADDLLAS